MSQTELDRNQPRLPSWAWVLLPFGFGALALLWSYLTPFDDAPDEWAHYHFNVEHLLDTGRLPVSGVDDRSAFFAGRLNRFGAVSARYSYVSFQPLPYVLAAASARTLQTTFGIAPQFGARAMSIIAGIFFAFMIAQTLTLLTQDRFLSLWTAATFCFVPQVVYLSSYLNTDMFSLSVSALLAYALVRLLKRPGAQANLLLLGLAAGLLVCSKYNYYVYFPFLALAAAYCYWFDKIPRRALLQSLGAAAAGVSACAGYFLLRNYYLYRDFLGVKFVREQMLSAQGRLGESQSLNLRTVLHLLHRGFFYDTFKTAIAEFGYLSIQLDPISYTNFYWCLAGVSILFVSVVVLRGTRQERQIAGCFAALCFAVWFLYIYNSLAWDYQPQGRYLFPLLVPLAMLVAHLLTSYRELRYAFAVLSVAVFLLLAESQTALLRKYTSGVLPTTAYTTSQAALTPTGSAGNGYDNAVPAKPIELIPGRVIEQPFRATQDGLTAIAVWTAKDAVRTVHLHKIAILDGVTGEALRESYVFPFEFAAANGVTFAFRRLEISKHRSLVLKLTTEQSVPSLSTSLSTVTPADPAASVLLIDGKPQANSLAITLLYE